jgi:predicted Zn-dependent protease
MAELHRAQQQGIRNGLDTRGLEPLMEKIVPPFMAEAIEDRRPFDAVQAWRLYGGKLRDVAVRNRCQRPLATALASLGLNREAMEIIKRLKQAGMEDPGLARIEAEMLLEQGDAAEAVELLEPLASARQDAERAATLRLLARANERLNRPLAAAQALQALARTPGLEPDELGETLMRAGNLFTRQGMPVQAIELGLQGLVYEREQAKRSPTAGWKPTVGNGLGLMLARAYATRNDVGRSALVLNALLARPWLTPEQTAEARWMLARADAQLGRQKESAATLTQLIKDEKTPALWRAAATDAQALNTWDEKNPTWAMNPVAASGP